MVDMRAWERKWEKENAAKSAKPPTKRQLSRLPPKVGRNEPCPCGSGAKFKRCCLDEAGRRPEVE